MNKFALLLGVLGAPFYIFAAGPGSDLNPAGGSAVVEINGVKLGIADLEQKNPGALFQARNSYYAAQKKAVDEFVDEYLLEQQAKKENLTVAQLLDKHVTSTIAKDPSEEALRVYYEGVDTNEPYEAVRGKIIDALRSRRIAKAKAAYMQALRKQATVSVRLSPPRAEIALRDTPVRGGAAPVTVVEYADYECPYCQQIQPALQKLEADYKGRVAFVYKDMPLPMHPHAQKAAEATHCAEAQGKYWEYHDALFASKQLGLPDLKQSARSLNLDAAAFDKCLDSGATAEKVRVYSNEAQTLGVEGTPTFFVNGRLVNGTVSYDSLRALVDEELATSPARPEMAKR
ncbi:MAG: thioredoxin domain-containing protein [Acidobacteriaceae bacterium]|nr:thioredoxin domain-containing protein [Acidobacteriaceae bacterium]